MSARIRGTFRHYKSVDVTAENLEAIADLLSIDRARLKPGKKLHIVQEGDDPIQGPYKGQPPSDPNNP
jgi:hypothetical protein